nr:protein HESO1 [Ipomoea batatas]
MSRAEKVGLLKMNRNGVFEVTLQNILSTINPLKEDWSKRFQVIDDLRAVVLSIESLRDATVEPYGSFVSDLFTRWGDLDISIELANAADISPTALKKLKEILFQDVLNALRSTGGYKKLKLIPNARVPILMFHGKYNISCDLSVNNLVGQMKSKLLYWISLIDARFRDLVLLVKEWAKTHNINDSKRGTLNSYSLCLLVIFHFQTCEPLILPPMKEIYPGNMVDDLDGVRGTAEKSIEERCAVNINKFVSDRLRVHNQSSLSELFISFLTKFSDISSKASKQCINPYTGQWEDLEGNMRWQPNKYSIIIEDPFEQPVNSARGVSSKQLARISETFKTTSNKLSSPNQDPSLHISTLVRPRVSRSLAKTHTRSHGKHSREVIKVQTSSEGNAAILGSSRPQFECRSLNKQDGVTPRLAQAPPARVKAGKQPSLQRQFDRQPNSVMPRHAKAPCASVHPVQKPKSDK